MDYKRILGKEDCKVGLTDYFLYGVGIGIGADATKIALAKGEEAYRKKYFDSVVHQDLNTLREQGGLLETAYPFPDAVKLKKPPFFVRHKIFTIGCIGFLIYLAFVVMFILRINQELAGNMFAVGVIGFNIFWSVGLLIMLVKKLLRGGKKVADFSFQWKYLEAGKAYWNIREQVRVALLNKSIDVQAAEYHLKNTELASYIFR